MTYSVQEKVNCLFKYNNQTSLRKFAKNVNPSKSTIHNWIKSIKENTFILTKKRKCKSIVSKNIIQFILGMIDINPYTSINELVTQIKKHFKIKLSNSTINRVIKSNNITRKRIKYFIKKTDTYYEELKKKQNKFKSDINRFNKRDIVCLDESCFYTEMVPNYGYSKKGKLISKPKKHYKTQKYTLLMAITNTNVIAHEIYKGSVNTDIFKNFMKDKLLLLCNNKHIIMDNVPFHHSK